MADLNLGNAVGLIAKVLAPAKRFILWARTDNVDTPNYYEILRPDGTTSWALLHDDGFDKGTFLWRSTVNYNTTTNRFAYRDFKLWQSQVDNNLNNVPATGSLNWTEVPIREGVILPTHQPGVYGSGLIMVAHPTTGIPYRLNASTRPYLSANLAAEITAGDWVEVGQTTSTPDPIVQSDNVTLTLNTPGTYVYTGSANATWTLRELISPGAEFRIKNAGSGELTIDGDGADIFIDQAVSDFVVFPGESMFTLVEGNTQWYK